MKIHAFPPGQPVGAGQGFRKAGVAGPDFQQLLQGELRKVAAAAPTQEAEAIPSVQAGVRLEGLTLTETAMTTLQEFARALENTSLPAEALEPFVSTLEEETVALLSVRNQLSASDPLAQVLDRVATVAYLEAAKFRRGDYHV